MSIDKYLARDYHVARYNCAHFVCEVWADLKGPEMAEALRGFLCGPSKRRAVLSDIRKFTVLDTPADPCVVYMRGKRGRTHVGVWIRGRVLHLPEKSNAQYQPIDVATIGFDSIRFITC